MFAVGYRKGLIGLYQYMFSSVTSTQKLTQFSRFHAHEKDICGMFWRFSDISCGESTVDLVSTGRDQFVKVWDVEKSWCHSSIRVPGSTRASTSSKQSSRSAKDNNGSTGTPWICACQTKPGYELWISGLRGEIYQWSMNEVSSASPKSVAPNIHTMLIFAMRSIPNSNNLLITVSQDRQVLVWQSTEQNLLVPILRIPTLAGGISALAQSDHGNGPVAAGVSDGSLLLWRPFPEPYAASGALGRDLVVLWPRGQNASGITALAWHPSPKHESLLAYGTEAGCVDLLDTAKQRKTTNSNKSKAQPYMFGTTVYRVVWGPRLFDRDSDGGNIHKQIVPESDICHEVGHHLSGEFEGDVTKYDGSLERTEEANSLHDKFSFYVYSVCKGKIFCHLGFQRTPLDVTLRFPQPSGTNMDEWIECKRTDISFLNLDKPRNVKGYDPTCDPIIDFFDWVVTLGYRDGRVDVYVRRRSTEPGKLHPSNLFPLCTLSTQTKGINCLAWSYDHYRIAIGSNEPFITVVDLTHILLSAIKSSGFSHIKSSTCLARLQGHCNRITGLDWSPHDPALLLSSSFDGTANVWSVQVGHSPQNYLSVANFRAHRLRLFSCLWSRTESDLAFSGGELRHLLGWRPSKLFHTEPPNARRYRPPPVRKAQNIQPDVDNSLPVNNCNTSVSISSPSNLVAANERETQKSSEVDTSTGQPESITKSISAKKSDNKKTSEKSRKRPSLFPRFLQRVDIQTNQIDVTSFPPIQISSKLAQVTHVFRWLYDSVPLPLGEQDLLFLLPDSMFTRRQLIRFLDQQASHHFQAYLTAQNVNGLMHLDAYCMILLWMGRVSQVSSTIVAEHHMPFWLLWCLNMTKSTEPWFTEQSVSGYDLPGEKAKEMMSISSDVFICATILVSAGRSTDAVNLLINSNRLKEALLLARLRLDPQDAHPLLTKCLELMIRNQTTGDVPFLNVIYQLGYGTISNVNALIQRAIISQPGNVVDELAIYWTQFVISLRSADSSFSHGAMLQLIRSCLLAGFELSDDDESLTVGEKREAYFSQWKLVFRRPFGSTPIDSSLSVVFPILDSALLVSRMLSQGGYVHMQISMEFSATRDQLLMLLDQLTINRMSSSQWPTCMLHVALDLTAAILVYRPQTDDTEMLRQEQTKRLLQLTRALQECAKLDSVKANRLINNLIIFSKELGSAGAPLHSAFHSLLEP
ncbi:Gem associated protein 5 [Fasciola gigantica]|uniref:Gem associated protein 5 n=1 Tax=Fasciola gigantica TaxID=46835 RepID=A0A504Y6S9_FASGI|nr:Gem associated protein 5 [Fasciola gigantica]